MSSCVRLFPQGRAEIEVNQMVIDEVGRLSSLASVLAAVSAALDAQEQFYTDELTVFAVRDTRRAALQAVRKASGAARSGPTMRRAAIRTALVDIARAVMLARDILENIARKARGEEWPDLAAAADAALDELRMTIRADPRLFAPSGIERFDVASLAASRTEGMEGWKSVDSERHVLVEKDGVILTVIQIDSGSWVAQVGCVYVGGSPTAIAAAAAARQAHCNLLAA